MWNIWLMYTSQELFPNNLFISIYFSVDSAEIQILNPWVKIPDDWNSGSYSDESSSTSSESTYSMSSAQAQYYSSSYGGSDTGTEPFFDHAMMTNLSEHLGSNAFLRCRVKKLGDGTVSEKTSIFNHLIPKTSHCILFPFLALPQK